MAEVFSGHALGSHGFQKPVAIKRLLPELADDAEFVGRLIEEAKLLVGMSHGNIVSVLDLVREAEDVFLVMEFVDGPSLRQLLQSRASQKLEPLPLAIATYIVHAAATGLEFAHAHDGGAIIHADISPSNLLLTGSGEVKVADFGIARREGVNTQAGVVEGKWAYMAPEQARGEALAPRSDVFALGVVLYELITGVHPFARRVTQDGRDEHAAKTVVPPRVVRPAIPHALDVICMRAIAHDPRQRTPTMQHLADDLVEQRFANGWRDGAPELAQIVKDVRIRPRPIGHKTQITDKPVTIITRSLLGGSASASHSTSEPAVTNPRLELPPGRVIGVEEISASSTPLAEGTARRPAGRSSKPRIAENVTSHELASVVGGNTQATAAQAIDSNRGRRWMFVGVILAAAIGGIAGLTLKVLPDDDLALAEPPPTERLPEPPQAPMTSVVPIESPPPPPPRLEPTLPTAPAAVSAPAVETETPPSKPVRIAKRDKDKSRATSPRTADTKTPPVDQPSQGWLHVFSEPWAYVTVGDRQEETPGAKFTLPPGTYTVKLHNPEKGLRTTRKVTIKAGKIERLSVRLEGT
jgi:serine/threonine-protein kinase